MEPAVFCTLHCLQIEGFRDGQVSFEDGHRPGRPVSVRHEQTVLFVKIFIEENPHITIPEICERLYSWNMWTMWRFNWHSRENCSRWFYMNYIVARWIPNLPNDQQKKQRVECSKDLLKMFEPDGPKSFRGGITDDKTFLYFSDIPIKRSNQMWVAADGKKIHT